MVEQTASIKLRGFVDGVGGQVVETDAGVIKVKLPHFIDVEVTGRRCFLGWFNAEDRAANRLGQRWACTWLQKQVG